jgi:hypothetical protein
VIDELRKRVLVGGERERGCCWLIRERESVRRKRGLKKNKDP